MSRHPATFIRVVGVALTVSACKTGEVTTHNPPAQGTTAPVPHSPSALSIARCGWMPEMPVAA
jgi:hypothetical protein